MKEDLQPADLEKILSSNADFAFKIDIALCNDKFEECSQSLQKQHLAELMEICKNSSDPFLKQAFQRLNCFETLFDIFFGSFGDSLLIEELDNQRKPRTDLEKEIKTFLKVFNETASDKLSPYILEIERIREKRFSDWNLSNCFQY